MAKKGSKKEEAFEKKLWKAADKLRKNIDAAEYKHVVLGLIFLKYISDAFEDLYEKLKKGEGEYIGVYPELIEKDVFRIVIPLVPTNKEITRKSSEKIIDLIKENPDTNTLFNILAERVGSKLVEKVGSKLVESQIKILLLVNENSKITKKEMSNAIGISTTAIDKNVEKLKSLGILRRVGPDKGGYWEVVKDEE